MTVGPVGNEEVGSSLPDIQYQVKVTLSPSNPFEGVILATKRRRRLTFQLHLGEVSVDYAQIVGLPEPRTA